MALKAGARALLNLYAQQAANPDFGAGPDAQILVDVSYGSGVGDRLAEAVHFSENTLAGAAAETRDLTMLLDGNGDALAAAQVMLFCVEADEANVGNIQIDVGTAVADSWTALLSVGGATDQAQLDVAPGTAVAMIAVKSGSYPVGASNKAFQVTNLDATNDATYRLFVLASRS